MRSQEIRGVHVFWGIAAFFGLMIAVQTVFVVLAVSTFPGEEEEKSYVQGIDYNRTLERRAQQAELGWTAQAGIRTAGGPDLVVRLADRNEAPVGGLNVSAMYHVVGAGREETALNLVELRPGEYQAPFEVLPKSRVELNIVVRRAGENTPVFQAGKTLVTP